jgi:hypothetical protein
MPHLSRLVVSASFTSSPRHAFLMLRLIEPATPRPEAASWLS